MLESFFATYLSSTIRFLFLLAPFFVVTMFLALTRGLPAAEKASIIRRACVSAFVLGGWCCFLPARCCSAPSASP